MASGIPTRRRRDENAPPALRTRSSTAVVTQSSLAAAKTTRSTATEAVKAVATTTTRSSIPVMKRQSTATSIKSRAALGDMTNAAKAKVTATGEKGKGKEAVNVIEKKPLATTSAPNTRRTRTTTVDQPITEKPAPVVAKRKAAVPPSRSTTARSRSTTASTSTLAESKPLLDRPINIKEEKVEEPARKRRKTSSPVTAQEDDLVDEAHYDEDGQEILLSSGSKPVGLRSPRRIRAKDEGWNDLDAEDEGDPSMVSEYVVDAFNYMMQLEKTTMASPTYMDDQTELHWNMRSVLMDWLIEVHAKFRLLPETLFIAINLVDRFLSARVISLVKFQLVGLTALFVASKYEEVICPSVTHFLHMADGGYGVEEILKAERYLLSVLAFDMSYPNPLHFLRRISKADGYDIQTRTVSKFLIEISAIEHKLLQFSPSVLAAASMWLARLCLERGPWTPNLVHYSSYAVEEFIEAAQIMLDYLLDDEINVTTSFFKKYASKKHMKASVFMHAWATNRWPDSVVNGDSEDVGIELYEEAGIDPPAHRIR